MASGRPLSNAATTAKRSAQPIACSRRIDRTTAAEPRRIVTSAASAFRAVMMIGLWLSCCCAVLRLLRQFRRGVRLLVQSGAHRGQRCRSVEKHTGSDRQHEEAGDCGRILIRCACACSCAVLRAPQASPTCSLVSLATNSIWNRNQPSASNLQPRAFRAMGKRSRSGGETHTGTDEVERLTPLPHRAATGYTRRCDCSPRASLYPCACFVLSSPRLKSGIQPAKSATAPSLPPTIAAPWEPCWSTISPREDPMTTLRAG